MHFLTRKHCIQLDFVWLNQSQDLIFSPDRH